MNIKKNFLVEDKVKIFQVENPWVYINVPKKYTEQTMHLADRGLVAITATLDKSSWNTSLMPMGDGTHFIPLPAKIREAEHVNLDDQIKLSFKLRKR